jgi:glycine hydroxymethyltransferase
MTARDDRHQPGGRGEPHSGYFAAPLSESDPELAGLIGRELTRQRDQVELIASENIVSRAVLEAQGSVLTNKTVEGYPGRRYHGGTELADGIERLAIARATELFGCRFANVQPHSGSQANQVVYLALLKPGDPVLAMSLAAGGHLSHGAAPNQSGKWFDVAHYGVTREDSRIDMAEVARLAEQHRPKLIIAGGSAYPRVIDFAGFREIAESLGARLLVDMAHFAGLVAGGAHPSPLPHAHIVTTTTYKSLRGARGGLILTDDEALAKRIDSALFPGVQGSPLLHAMAGKAACMGEALRPEFAAYARAVLDNARTLAAALAARGHEIVSGGTDTALMLLDLRPKGLTGDVASARLEDAGLTCNKNAVPFDPEKPAVTSGLRLSSAAGTTRGFGSKEFRLIGGLIADVLDELAADPEGPCAAAEAARSQVAELCRHFPIYAGA